MATFDWAKVRWATRARVGTVVAFLFDDDTRKVAAGQLGLVVWDAGRDKETGKRYTGRDVLTSDGRTVNIPHYELRPAGSHAHCFTMPARMRCSRVGLDHATHWADECPDIKRRWFS